jgi:hypothetical protein
LVDVRYEFQERRGNLVRRLWAFMAKHRHYDWGTKNIHWSGLRFLNQIEESYSLKGIEPKFLKSISTRPTASWTTPKTRQIRIHNFHTTSARAQDAQCAQTDAAGERGAGSKALVLAQEGPALRRSHSEGHLPCLRTIRVRDGIVREATLFSSSSLCRDRTPIGPESAVVNDTNDITAEDGFVQSTDEEAPHIPLSYKIPEDAMRSAMLTLGVSSAAHWHHGLYQGPNGEKVKVHYCRSKETSERVAQYFLNQEVIGFDIEWKSNSKTTDGIRYVPLRLK